MTRPGASTLDRQIASLGGGCASRISPSRRSVICTGAARKLATWLEAEWGVRDSADIAPTHIRDFIISILDTRSSGYASNLFRSLQQFWKW